MIYFSGSGKMEISETIQTITRLCARNSRENICKTSSIQAIKTAISFCNEMIHEYYFSPPLRMCSDSINILGPRYVLNDFCLFELIRCIFESCQVGLPGLKQCRR